MQYFIDLGCFKGTMIDRAIKAYPKCSKFIGFEPVPELYNALVKKYAGNPKIEIKPVAASVKDGDSKFYISRVKKNSKAIGQGSTLFSSKATGNINTKDCVNINTINFSKYLSDNFKSDDTIILKMNIEGSEYDILEDMIKTGTIKMIDKLFCEWHVNKIPGIPQSRHDDLIKSLSANGFGVVGSGHSDGFGKFLSNANITK